jgi:hypothetical protein
MDKEVLARPFQNSIQVSCTKQKGEYLFRPQEAQHHYNPHCYGPKQLFDASFEAKAFSGRSGVNFDH